MKTLIAFIMLASSLACSAQVRSYSMTNLPALVTTLATSNLTSIGTFRSDSETALWLTCYGTNANATGNLALVVYVSHDGTNYGTEPIRFNFTPSGSSTSILRTNLSIELSRMCKTFKLSQITNASASSVWASLNYSRKY